MAYCTNCGNKLGDMHKYCGNCGNKVIINNISKCDEIIFPEITYKTPIGRSDNPFDVNSPYNFFCDASGLTYLGELNDFTKCYLEFEPWNNENIILIPGGHKTIVALERKSLICEGNIIWNNPIYSTEAEMFREKLRAKLIDKKIYKHNDDETRQYYVINSDGDSLYIRNFVGERIYMKWSWDTYEEAIEYAKKYSVDEKKTCLIAQSLYRLNWH